MLYFFNLVNVPFMKQVDAGMKPKVFQYLTLPALQWFRWSALLTVFVGFWYWAQIYVAADAERMGVSPWSTIGFFLLIWIVSWGILYFVISKAPSGYVLGLITAVVVIAAGYLFVNYTPVGQDDNHVLAIGVGGGMGIIMLFNVWGIIWPNQKKIIQGTLAGTPPANAAALGPSGLPGVADQLLPLGSHAVLHGLQLPLRDFRKVGGGLILLDLALRREVFFSARAMAVTANQPEYLHGIALFNQGKFFDAHEVLEDVWRASPARREENLAGARAGGSRPSSLLHRKPGGYEVGAGASHEEPGGASAKVSRHSHSSIVEIAGAVVGSLRQAPATSVPAADRSDRTEVLAEAAITAALSSSSFPPASTPFLPVPGPASPSVC